MRQVVRWCFSPHKEKIGSGLLQRSVTPIEDAWPKPEDAGRDVMAELSVARAPTLRDDERLRP